MTYRVRSILLACTAFTAVLTAAVEANAGSFALREQSSYGQGSSFAGVAAGGSLSSMFWNPATMTQTPGFGVEAVATAILPYANQTPGATSTLAALGGVDNSGNSAFVPSGYVSYQFNRDFWLGLSINSPFGLSTSFPNLWAGRDFAANSSLLTANATPTIAYRINNWISVGVGVQVQYARAMFGQGVTAGGPTFFSTNLSGAGMGYGFTGGITLTPGPNTSIGLGYRSAIDQKINGTFNTGGLPGSNGSVTTTVNLPDSASLGIRHRFDAQWTVMGTAEWTHWSRIGAGAPVFTPGGVQAVLAGNPVAIPFNYRDGWFYSVGAEYQWTPQYAFRAGIGFERSPVQDQFRSPIIPDNDRLWLSAGASNNLTRNLRLDFAYSHIFVRDPSINLTNAGGTNYNGTVKASVDIFSVALKYNWDVDPPARKLVTK